MKQLFNKSVHLKYLLELKIKEKALVDKSSVFSLVKTSDLNTKLATLTTKAALKTEQDKTVPLQVSHPSYFCSKSHFEDEYTEL